MNITTFKFSFRNDDLDLDVAADGVSAWFNFFIKPGVSQAKSRNDINYIQTGHQEPGQDTSFLRDIVEQFLQNGKNLLVVLDYLNIDPNDTESRNTFNSLQEILTQKARKFLESN